MSKPYFAYYFLFNLPLTRTKIIEDKANVSLSTCSTIYIFLRNSGIETGKRFLLCATDTGDKILYIVHALVEGRKVFAGGHIFE